VALSADITSRIITYRPVADDPGPYRVLALAVLEQAVRDARRGRDGARDWITSYEAKRWADMLDLPTWPPRLPQ
jgi:hypothetical protein